MSFDIGFTNRTSGATIYALVQDAASGTYYIPATGLFSAYVDIATHRIALTEISADYYLTTVATNIPSAMYTVKVYVQFGGSADITTDGPRDERTMYYNALLQQAIEAKDFWELIESLTGGSGGGGLPGDLAEVLRLLKNVASKVRAN